ncbi:MAG TPA: MBL fold metallo-hydrolase [Dehalococcoidia bacterium]|nr:MBL fold metallo-hydrolase [Dehalococcoidia bacterium]
MKPFRVWREVYAIGGPELSHPYDCCVYLIGGAELVLIDSGAGESFDQLVDNIKSLGFKPEKLRAVVATHAHIDHIGALYQFRDKFGVQVIAHELDAGAIETGMGTGAEFYGVAYNPCKVDIRLSKEEESLQYGGYKLKAVHIPGHTPGSIAVYVDVDKRVLFGQDIHGPYFLKGSDPTQARISLQKLIDLEADILCEGHFGIYQPATEVKKYIEGYLYSLYS